MINSTFKSHHRHRQLIQYLKRAFVRDLHHLLAIPRIQHAQVPQRVHLNLARPILASRSVDHHHPVFANHKIIRQLSCSIFQSPQTLIVCLLQLQSSCLKTPLIFDLAYKLRVNPLEYMLYLLVLWQNKHLVVSGYFPCAQVIIICL